MENIEISNPEKLYTWAIYKREPSFHAMRFETMSDGTIGMRSVGLCSDNIDELRRIFVNHGLTKVFYHGDAPDIVETWI
jgi:hypothetical protein